MQRIYKSLLAFSSITGLAFFIYTVANRIIFILHKNTFSIDKSNEISNLLYDIPFLIPAVLGLFVFLKRPTSKAVFTSYIIYLLAGIAGLLAMIFSTDALEAGLSILLFSLPLCVISIIILLFVLLLKKSA